MPPEEKKTCTGECASEKCTKECKAECDKANASCPFATAKAKVGDTVYFFESGIVKSTVSKRYAVIVDNGGEYNTRFGYTVSGMDIPGDNLYTSKQQLLDYVNSLDAEVEPTAPEKEEAKDDFEPDALQGDDSDDEDVDEDFSDSEEDEE